MKTTPDAQHIQISERPAVVFFDVRPHVLHLAWRSCPPALLNCMARSVWQCVCVYSDLIVWGSYESAVRDCARLHIGRAVHTAMTYVHSGKSALSLAASMLQAC